jgi:hypothetical protein
MEQYSTIINNPDHCRCYINWNETRTRFLIQIGCIAGLPDRLDAPQHPA